MNLRQAYDGWAQQQQNRALYVKTRDAFRKAWFMLETNKPCSYYTRQILGEALAQTRVVESMKVSAASVMCHVLTWANFAEPKFNPKPDFTYSDLMEYTKGPLADPAKIGQTDPVADLPCKAMAEEAEAERKAEAEQEQAQEDAQPLPAPVGEGQGVGSVSSPDIDNQSESNLNETNMSEQKKKHRGREPRPVVRISADSLLVKETFESVAAASRAAGIKDVCKAIRNLQKGGDSYWAYAEKADETIQAIRDKQAAPKQAPKKASKQGKTAPKQPKPLHGKQAEEALRKTLGEEIEQFNRETAKPKPTTSPKPSAAQQALAVFSDDDLLAELDRRGWEGELKRTQVVSIGK